MTGEICKIALTGGPAGGKSTLQRLVAQQLPGAYCVPEAASIILSGFPKPSEQHPWTQDWQNSLQRAVIATQISLEEISEERAAHEGKSLIVCDRGLPDAAAYLTGGMPELAALTQKTEEELLAPYHTVIHLPSSAGSSGYNRSSNPARFEEAEAAKRVEAQAMEVWDKHPNRIILDNPSLHYRTLKGLQIIRKQLVPDLLQ